MIRSLAKIFRRFLVLLRGRIAPADSVVPLQAGTPVNLDLDKFTRGIDNVHVDVRLSPTFMNAAARLVISLLEYQLWRGQGGAKSPDVEEFKNAYGQMIQLKREIQNALASNWAEVRESMTGTTVSIVASLNELLRGVSTSEISTSLFALPRQLSDINSELAKLTRGSEQSEQLLLSMRDAVDDAIDELRRIRDSPGLA